MDPDEFERFRRRLEQQASPAADDIARLAHESRSTRLRAHLGVRRQVLAEWRGAWDCWDAVVYAAEQNAAILARRSDPAGADTPHDDHEPVRTALCLIQFAGTQTLKEVGILLTHGLWAGAAARWRAMHELAVTAVLIAKGGPPIATRYLDHGHVVQTRRLHRFRAAHGRGPVGEEELGSRLAHANELIARHTLANQSTTFAGSYGWAAPLMPLDKHGKHVKPTFDLLESEAELAGLRLLVATAHGLVHNDSAGVLTAVLGESDGASLEWIAGPIPRHIGTVAKPAMISIGHLQAATLLGFEPEWNDAARALAMCAVSTAALVASATDAFENPS